MRSRANPEWVVQLDVLAETVPSQKEGWVRLVMSRDVAKELLQELQWILEKK